MDSIQIKTGNVELKIVRDGAEVGSLKFNPGDNLFAEKFYAGLHQAQVKAAEFQRIANELDSVKEKDDDGYPVNMQERLSFRSKFCQENYAIIDSIFGEGKSAMLFGDELSFDVFSQFFEGVLPYFKRARSEKVDKYIPHSQKPRKRTRRK